MRNAEDLPKSSLWGMITTILKKGAEVSMNISKESTMGDLLRAAQDNDVYDAVVNVLLSAGMHCIGCPSHQFETLEEACYVHGIDVTDLVSKLEAAVG